MSGTAAPQIEFRSMVEADLLAASRLWLESEGVELAEGDSPTQLADYLRRNPGSSQVAFAGDRMIGAVLAGHDGRRGILYHLAVASERRGSGVGRELVNRCLAALKASHIDRVLVLVSRENQAGMRFWQKGGWKGLGTAQPMGIDL